MLVGFQSVDITPPLGVPLSGHFVRRPSDEIHDPITAFATVLDDGQSRVALVGTDTIGLPKWLVDASREQIRKQTEIPGEAVMLWATHTHAGPVLEREHPHGCHPEYNNVLPKLIASAVAGAVGNLQETTARVAIGHEDRISFNRRYRMRSGGTHTNPGVGNPSVAGVDGPTDPDVGVLFFDRDGVCEGAVVNFACHPDVIGSGNHQYSGDYPFFLRDALRDAYGSDFFTMFGNGACGNLNHINVFGKKRQGGFDHSRLMGRTLAGEVMKCDYVAGPVELGPISYASEKVALNLREFTSEEIAEYRALLADPEVAGKRISSGDFTRGKAERALAIVDAGITSEEVEVQVLRLGDVAIVSIPGEYFVEFGLAIKQQSCAQRTFLIELANGCIGYIPTAAALAAGAYEGSSAKYSADAGQVLADAAIATIEAMWK